MTKEEFEKKLETDQSFQKSFENNPFKVIEENEVEFSDEELMQITGGKTLMDLFLVKVTKKEQ